jgi:phosphoribosylanthranilate isomerase
MRPRIKICCIADVREARMAIEYGASALGLVGRMPSGPGPIPDERIRAIARTVPPPVATFLLTSETGAGEIIAHHQRTHTNTLQLVDAVPPGAYAALRATLPAVKLVQVIHVRDERNIDDALQAAAEVDALLLDSGNPDLEVKELGGTGRTHNWQISRRICEQSPVPVFLAGGLRPDNVRRAIDAVQPFGLDLCTGVRTNGALDREKLERFFRAAGY